MASLGYRFKHFIKRHERWFTFAGAFIVFMTFVIKEQLGERWRGISDALDNAGHMYELQKGSSETQAQLDSLLHIIQTRNALTESVPEDIPEGAPRLSYDEPTYFTWYHGFLIEVQDTLHNVSIVTDKMPHSDPRLWRKRRKLNRILTLVGNIPLGGQSCWNSARIVNAAIVTCLRMRLTPAYARMNAPSAPPVPTMCCMGFAQTAAVILRHDRSVPPRSWPGIPLRPSAS